ncbi:capsular polysaccharide synthesis enzyme [Staphylococcus massiliensis]|uniref:Capsular polysaccharide synthesis enzyme n=1 Tax=Staphylococcus massiliensis S46 TaxID=1229783 RepID=K9B8C7_9STAP|nr:capsular polysaccharide synthesis enzyme [Staphylococcus massiliensis]EKU49990.1 capsular polysaccharide synthesis enzyme [Staphylococcus massiliensis S46]
MRIATLSSVNVKHMTLISHYLENIDLNKHQVDLIYADKHGVDEYVEGVRRYKFNIQIDPDWSKLRKIKTYLGYKNKVLKLLEANDYDFVIVWGSYTAHLFSKILKRKYEGKYIINIRDYFHEKNPIIKFLLKRLIDKSKFVTLSSEGFKTFLPKSNKYFVIYSANHNIISEARIERNFKREKPLRISFIGNNRFFNVHENLLMKLKNDDRFVLQYFGTGSERLAQFAKENDINNVKFLGGFPIEETPRLLDETDILNNVYGNNDIALDTALSIRLYYAIYLRKPILTSPNTFTSKKAHDLSLGFDVNLENDKLGDEIWDWYSQKLYQIVNHKVEKEIKEIENRNTRLYDELKKVVEDEGL